MSEFPPCGRFARRGGKALAPPQAGTLFVGADLGRVVWALHSGEGSASVLDMKVAAAVAVGTSGDCCAPGRKRSAGGSKRLPAVEVCERCTKVLHAEAGLGGLLNSEVDEVATLGIAVGFEKPSGLCSFLLREGVALAAQATMKVAHQLKWLLDEANRGACSGTQPRLLLFEVVGFIIFEECVTS